VRYIVEGGIRQAGAMIRVSVDLVDAETGVHLWAEKYDREFATASVFALQDDLTDRVVATVADSSGVLVRSMANPLRERAVSELSLSELMLRFMAYVYQVRLDEHARLRDAIARALSREPANAEGWACLAALCGHEHMWSANPLPQPLERQREAAERAVDIDPTCQYGWENLAGARHFGRDAEGFRSAADRALALNPRNANTSAFLGTLLAFAGDWDRGLTIVKRAMTLNPQHPGWYHFAWFYDQYRQGNDAEASAHLKRVNMPEFLWTHLTMAAVSGQLGRQADARAALAALRKLTPGPLDAARVRKDFEHWQRDEGLIDRLMDGLRKAGL
jgi:hypothetical protein